MRRMLLLWSITMLAPGSVTAQARPDTRRDSADTRKRLERQTTQFLDLWQVQWKRSSRRVAGSDEHNPTAPGAVRLRNLHCHWDGSYYGADGKRNPGGAQASLIRSNTTHFSVCPDWVSDDSLNGDEAINPDVWLSESSASIVRDARARLLDSLDVASRTYRYDGWLSGQRVRFHLDAQHPDSALRAAEECRSDRAWCEGLRGLVHLQSGDVTTADSLFRAMLSHMDDAVRCTWASIQPLLEPRDQRRYSSLDCKQQAIANDNFWWLSDPLFIDPANERRAEHFARRIRLAIHTALPNDAIWQFRNTFGGDAVQTMLVRYGWPTRSWWGGAAEDAAHSSWLAQDAVEPYSVPEYSLARMSTSPTWEAVLNPLTTSNADFVLVAPPGLEQHNWWPREHFRSRNGTIVDIDEGQVALFRRDSATMFVLATRVASDLLAARTGERVDANVVFSPAPDRMVVLATQRTPVGARLLARASLDSAIGLSGIEIATRDTSVPAARSRFGLVVPASLARLGADIRAISMPVLFQVPGGDMPMPDDVNSVVEQMYASTRVEAPTQLGIFWESYGFHPADTVSITVSLQRITRPGRWQRLGMALGLANDPNSAISVGWREPNPGHASKAVRASRPVLGRQLVMNVANLIAGDYRLAITMEPRSSAAVTSERVFSIVR